MSRHLRHFAPDGACLSTEQSAAPVRCCPRATQGTLHHADTDKSTHIEHPKNPQHVQAENGRRRSGSRKATARKSTKRWSSAVTRNSDALDLDKGVFSRRDPKSIARSLKRSAERSRRRKADPYRSALSMLTFYINRAGRKLPASRKRVLERAKTELREQFGR